VSADNTSAASWKFYQTQYKLLKSHSVLEIAAEKLDLYSRPEFVGRKLSPIRRLTGWARAKVGGGGGGAPADAKEAAIHFIEGGLAIRPVRDSQLVEVSFRDSSPTLAKDVANSATEAFLAFNYLSRW